MDFPMPERIQAPVLIVRLLKLKLELKLSALTPLALGQEIACY